jgi:hypothetical protein
MVDVIHISGQICKNCNEIPLTDLLVGFMICLTIVFMSKLVKRIKFRKNPRTFIILPRLNR